MRPLESIDAAPDGGAISLDWPNVVYSRISRKDQGTAVCRRRAVMGGVPLLLPDVVVDPWPVCLTISWCRPRENHLFCIVRGVDIHRYENIASLTLSTRSYVGRPQKTMQVYTPRGISWVIKHA